MNLANMDKGSKASSWASFITITYVAVGIISVLQLVKNWGESLPLIIFYFLILVNTHFSVSFFLSIIPQRGGLQKLINTALLLIYPGLAITFDKPLNFTLIAALLFTLATIKYILLAEESPFRKILWKKVLIETMGILACILTIFGILIGYSILATSLWTFCFLVANIYLLSIRPLYKLEE